MTEAKNLYQNRRSVYALGKNLPISEQEVLEIIDNAVKYSPSAFNSQTAHAVVLLGENHQKLWDYYFRRIRKNSYQQKKQKQLQKVKSIVLLQHMEQFYSSKITM